MRKMGDNETIVNKVRNFRVAKNLTQEQMAKALGINRATYINIESGKENSTWMSLVLSAINLTFLFPSS